VIALVSIGPSQAAKLSGAELKAVEVRPRYPHDVTAVNDAIEVAVTGDVTRVIVSVDEKVALSLPYRLVVVSSGAAPKRAGIQHVRSDSAGLTGTVRNACREQEQARDALDGIFAGLRQRRELLSAQRGGGGQAGLVEGFDSRVSRALRFWDKVDGGIGKFLAGLLGAGTRWIESYRGGLAEQHGLNLPEFAREVAWKFEIIDHYLDAAENQTLDLESLRADDEVWAPALREFLEFVRPALEKANIEGPGDESIRQFLLRVDVVIVKTGGARSGMRGLSCGDGETLWLQDGDKAQMALTLAHELFHNLIHWLMVRDKLQGDQWHCGG
jgi:hypothetical protein